MRRSGHHAVINWIRYQTPRIHVFLNACRPTAHPLDSCHLSQSRVGYGSFDVRMRRSLARVVRSRFVNYILYNFEDALPRLENDQPDQAFFGGIVMTVLVLRDPFNLLASRLHWERTFRARFSGGDSRLVSARLRQAAHLWKTFARRAMRPPEGRHLLVKYNDWCNSRDYRRQLARHLKLPGIDMHMDEIARWGPGSSFEGDAICSPDHRLRTLGRWRAFVEDDQYRDCVLDSELLELSRFHFPDLAASDWAQQHTPSS